MSDIVERLRFDAARCEATFSKGVATNIEEAATDIDRLRAALLSCPCPRPANSVPEHSEWTVMDCRNRNECGCVYGQALDGNGQLTPGKD